MANVNHFDSDHFEAALAQPGVVLVDFFATWCMPCKMVGAGHRKGGGILCGQSDRG